MTDALFSLPAHLRRRLVDALESGTLPAPCSPISLRSVLGVAEGAEKITGAISELVQLGMAGPACAAWIRAVEAASLRVPRPDLVWSGPEVAGVAARDTRRVFEELLGSATRSVWACSYAFFDGPKAFEVLAKRMEEVPDLQVMLLLNIQRKRGDTSVADDVVRRFADRFWSTDWPGKRRPRVFYDRRSLDLDGPAGVLHAKAVVTDDEAVFITSANLTAAAFDRNIEIGMLMRDRALAASVTSHFQALIQQAFLTLLPAS
jgi:phosphatidylserine/phosphatidylglycerophosphate/cardiolipin synthase-like enzyme